MATTAEIKNGLTINYNGNLVTIIEFQHVKPGKGGAFVRTKFKNIITGKVIDNTFRSGEKIEIVRLSGRDMQYLYQDDESYVFMDQENFEQIYIPGSIVEEAAPFLKEGEIAHIQFHGEKPLTLQLPNFINYKIVECEPGSRGDTVSNVTKAAKIESGASIQVPMFITEGEIIKVDTRTGTYVERVKS
jgi:elongation factor P